MQMAEDLSERGVYFQLPKSGMASSSREAASYEALNLSRDLPRGALVIYIRLILITAPPPSSVETLRLRRRNDERLAQAHDGSLHSGYTAG